MIEDVPFVVGRIRPRRACSEDPPERIEGPTKPAKGLRRIAGHLAGAAAPEVHHRSWPPQRPPPRTVSAGERNYAAIAGHRHPRVPAAGRRSAATPPRGGDPRSATRGQPHRPPRSFPPPPLPPRRAAPRAPSASRPTASRAPSPRLRPARVLPRPCAGSASPSPRRAGRPAATCGAVEETPPRPPPLRPLGRPAPGRREPGEARPRGPGRLRRAQPFSWAVHRSTASPRSSAAAAPRERHLRARAFVRYGTGLRCVCRGPRVSCTEAVRLATAAAFDHLDANRRRRSAATRRTRSLQVARRAPRIVARGRPRRAPVVRAAGRRATSQVLAMVERNPTTAKRHAGGDASRGRPLR